MIHLFCDKHDGRWQVWTDCEPESEKDGRCLGSGPTPYEAYLAASRELAADRAELDAMLLYHLTHG